MYQEQEEITSKEFEYQGKDGKVIFGKIWQREEKRPLGWLILFHGMGDHSGRFQDFASHLAGRGVGVFAPDLRGHGKTDTFESPMRGLLGPEKGWETMSLDLVKGVQTFLSHSGAQEFFLGAFELGGLLTLNALKTLPFHHHCKGVFLVGMRGPIETSEALTLMRAKSLFKKHGPLYHEDKMTTSHFSKLCKPFSPVPSAHSWRNRDERVVKSFSQDPYHTEAFPLGFWLEYYQGIQDLFSTPVQNDLGTIPLFLLFGALDTYSGGPGKIKNLIKHLGKWGFEKIETKIYPETRHEIIHELNRREVFRDIHRWIETLL